MTILPPHSTLSIQSHLLKPRHLPPRLTPPPDSTLLDRRVLAIADEETGVTTHYTEIPNLVFITLHKKSQVCIGLFLYEVFGFDFTLTLLWFRLRTEPLDGRCCVTCASLDSMGLFLWRVSSKGRSSLWFQVRVGKGGMEGRRERE